MAFFNLLPLLLTGVDSPPLEVIDRSISIPFTGGGEAGGGSSLGCWGLVFFFPEEGVRFGDPSFK